MYFLRPPERNQNPLRRTLNLNCKLCLSNDIQLRQKPALQRRIIRTASLLGAILQELVIEVVKVKGQMVSSFVTVPVLRDIETVQGLQHYRRAHIGKPGISPAEIGPSGEDLLSKRDRPGKGMEWSARQAQNCPARSFVLSRSGRDDPRLDQLLLSPRSCARSKRERGVEQAVTGPSGGCFLMSVIRRASGQPSFRGGKGRVGRRIFSSRPTQSGMVQIGAAI